MTLREQNRQLAPVASDVEEAEDYKVRGGRPPIEIDAEALRRLRQLHCTEEEVAAFFRVSTRTLKRRLKDEPWKGAWEDGINEGKASLRRLQWRHASGSGSSAVQMTIHLSKHWLGETDRAQLEVQPIDVHHQHDHNVPHRVAVADLAGRTDQQLADLYRETITEARRRIEQSGGSRN